MKKLSIYFLLLLLISACSTIKHVKKNQQLLTKNNIYVDSAKSSNKDISELMMQRPNARALGLPLSLYFYNLGNPNGSKTPAEWDKNHPGLYRFFKNTFSEKQSISVANSFIGLNNWYLTSGQAPVIIDDKKIKKTERNLKTYFQNEGYFKAKITSKRDTVGTKKGSVSYYIEKGKPLFLDSIFLKIQSPVLDSIYNANKQKSFLKNGDQYKDINFINEAERITKLFRNNGIYHFDKNSSIVFDEIDTAVYKSNVDFIISDRLVENNGEYINIPYKIQKIKKINVYTDYSYSKKDEPYNAHQAYNGVNFYAHKKLKYNPKYLNQSVFIKPNTIYSDSLRALTRIHFRSLKNFKSTSIRFNELGNDELEANIFLTPTEKYTLGFETELSRSNIRNFDVSAKFSLTNRNAFKGAELFKISASGSYFNSNNGPGWEIGTDMSLEIPRFVAPFGLSKLVPKSMFPKTKFFTGINIQRNIGLDKQNITAGLNYKWQFNKKKTIQLDIFNTQYVRNLNIDNYFNVYNSEYTKLVNLGEKAIPNVTPPQNTIGNFDAITNYAGQIFNNSTALNRDEVAELLNITNRYQIITSDFLIPEIAYMFTYNNQENTKDASFSYFRIRVANSGNIMGLLSNQVNSVGEKTVFKIPIAQYFKTDIEYKKYWDLGDNNVLAHRTFVGAIFPYDNSEIPFSRSYFAGGSNDIRAWRTYDLGPGATPPGLEYNIGSFKFLTSFEYRFNVIGNLKSAIFMDAGNIWDISNSRILNDSAKLKDFKSLLNMAVGTGFGIRYDFTFLIARLDVGFKVHEPYLTGNKWFQNFGFNNAVFNIGINYPF
ncbi:membrane protein [Tenacibaculum holothuriorum]|uniref:Membrane protein n=2 Tax=Tenacibaculum holothuriorum TaxID=1635173 RepID=A0A1Y2P8U2_9FLAO|nr:membrane protein [Tenacibaculum holothuriorum]